MTLGIIIGAAGMFLILLGAGILKASLTKWRRIPIERVEPAAKIQTVTSIRGDLSVKKADGSWR